MPFSIKFFYLLELAYYIHAFLFQEQETKRRGEGRDPLRF